MNINTGFCIVASVVLFAACSSDKGTSGPDASAGAGGASGSGTSASGTGGASGSAGSGAGGAGKGSGNDSGAGGADDSGASGANDAGAGGVGGDQGATTEHRSDLPGPTTADQASLILDAAHLHVADTFASGRFDRIATDGKGNVFVMGGNSTGAFVAKYGSTYTRTWLTTIPTKESALSMDVNGDGEVFLSGSVSGALAGETYAGQRDVFVAKLDVSGTSTWAHQWGSSGDETSDFVAAGPNGTVLATGTSTGQAPGNPATSARGPFAVQYESDGTRTWLKQYPPPSQPANPTSAQFVDLSGNLYIGSGPSLRKIDSAGTLQWDAALRAPFGLLGINVGGSAGVGGAAIAADGGSFYTFDTSGGLEQISLDGQVLWYRAEANQSATIDPVGGETWTGKFAGTTWTGIAVTNDSIYIGGLYNNAYAHGSSPKPATQPTFVGRYGIDGHQIWFQEYQPDAILTPLAIGVPLFLSVNPAGNLVVVFASRTSTFNVNSLNMFTVSKTDGTLL